MIAVRTQRWLRSPIGLTCLLALIAPSIAQSAWLGYKNDTSAVVVIQSATVVNGQVRRGKPHTLFPGEVAWDAIPSPGVRTVAVYDPKRNNQLVLQDAINIGNADVVLSLQLVALPVAKGQPVLPPQPRLIPVRVQMTPPGVNPVAPPTPTQPIVPGQPRTTPIPPKPPTTPGTPPKTPANPGPP